MQEPALRIAKNPCPLPLTITSHVVITANIACHPHFTAIPPTAFQPLRPSQQLQWAVPMRSVGTFSQRLPTPCIARVVCRQPRLARAQGWPESTKASADRCRRQWQTGRGYGKEGPGRYLQEISGFSAREKSSAFPQQSTPPQQISRGEPEGCVCAGALRRWTRGHERWPSCHVSPFRTSSDSMAKPSSSSMAAMP